MELISREDALSILEWFTQKDPLDMTPKALVEALPTIDAVPVVRCKDCKHYTEPNIEYCELYGAMILWSKDDFCSRGEKRTDEEIIHQYHERHKEVLKGMSKPVGRNVMDALAERRTDE